MRLSRPAALVVSTLAFLSQQAAADATSAYWDADDSCTTAGTTYFTAGGPAQYWHAETDASAWGGCYMWTTTTQNSEINYAEWYYPPASCTAAVKVTPVNPIPDPNPPEVGPNCTPDPSGDYQLLPYMNRNFRFQTHYAHYARYDCGHANGPTQYYIFNQGAASTGHQYIGSGYFFLNQPANNCDGFMRLPDLTYETTTLNIGFDDMEWYPH